MKKLIHITMVFASFVILIFGISIASDYASESKGYQDTTIASPNTGEYASESKGYQDTTTSVVTENDANADNYISNTHVFGTFIKKDNSKRYGFRKGLSYSGPCDSLPNGAVCLRYSDNYNWVVSDFRVDAVPFIVGVSSYKPIELIRCYNANYYHVLGTSLIMSTPHNYFISDLN